MGDWNYFYLRPDDEYVDCCSKGSMRADEIELSDFIRYSFANMENFFSAAKKRLNYPPCYIDDDYQIELVDGEVRAGCKTIKKEKMKEIFGAAKTIHETFGSFKIDDGAVFVDKKMMERVGKWLEGIE